MRKRFVVRGMVQGVNYRAAAAAQARRLRVTGRIWNRDDGAVECVAEADEAAMAELGAWLAHGPWLARVDGVEVTDLDGSSRHGDFRIEPER